MPTRNPANERIKRQYLIYLREAKRYSEASVDRVIEALVSFEGEMGFRDFRAFRPKHAVEFKKRLSTRLNPRTQTPLSKATLRGRLTDLKRFFQWLAGEPGFRSHLKYADAEYFGLSENECRIATARHQRPSPTLEQLHHVLAAMPHRTEIECRDRALIAFTLLTGARDGAIASLKLKHVDLTTRCVHQDAREVHTKFRKTFDTYFFGNVGDQVREIVEDWIAYLRKNKCWGNDDPLFPATATELGTSGGFTATGLVRQHWRQTQPFRRIFRNAFALSGLPYFHPHSVRNTLVALAEATCHTPEEFKAVSQNLGHEDPLTTFTSYGAVTVRRQGELIAQLGKMSHTRDRQTADALRTVLDELGITERLKATKG